MAIGINYDLKDSLREKKKVKGMLCDVWHPKLEGMKIATGPVNSKEEESRRRNFSLDSFDASVLLQSQLLVDDKHTKSAG